LCRPQKRAAIVGDSRLFETAGHCEGGDTVRPHHIDRSRIALVAACALAFVAMSGCNRTSATGASDARATTTSGNPSDDRGNATVDRVVDGDTIIVDIKGERERVRLIGIDTPETHRPDTPVQCYGPEAADYAARLLPPGTAVNIERDVETRDDYGRLLGYVTRVSDGMFVNLEMASAGYAKSLRVKPNTTFADVISEAVRDAQQHHRGLWGACSGFGVPADSAG
jgi:micrococcal nuclease